MIRVVRLLEYDFETPEDAERSMSNWSVPANGSVKYGPKNIIRSSIIIDFNSQVGSLPDDTN